MIYKKLEADERGWLIEGLNVLRDRWRDIFWQDTTDAEADRLSMLHRCLVGGKAVFIVGSDAELFQSISKMLGEDQ